MSDEVGSEHEVKAQTTKTVDFYGDRITVAQGVDEEIYVPLRPLTDFLGLDRTAQQRRVQRDPVLSKRLRTVRMDTGGGPQRVLCLPLDLLPGWLFGITTGKMASEMAEKLNRYREEGFKVLWNAFKGDILPYVPALEDAGLSKAEETLELINAIQQMAQQQVDLERRYNTMAGYMRGFVKTTNARLTAIEMRLDPENEVTVEQQAEIMIAVKNLAHALEQCGIANGYQQVYSELYRRFNVNSYKKLPRSRYEEVMNWLDKRRDEIIKGDK